MAVFIILAVIFLLVFVLSGQQKQNDKSGKFNRKPMTNAESPGTDPSIIDVTGKGLRIGVADNALIQYEPGVPYWSHRYIYAYEEINYTNTEQLAFYYHFKGSFRKGEYLDIEGNSNYAFILLFDLLKEFDKHNVLSIVEEQMIALANHYPKTRQYAIPFLIRHLEQKGMWTTSVEVRGRNAGSVYGCYSFEGNYWGLGSRYKAKLQLPEADTKLLDTLYYSSNNFFEVEFCALEVLKLFVCTVRMLREVYERAGTSLDKEFAGLSDIILRKHYNYRANSWNYTNGQDTARNDIYLGVLKHCENAVREKYGHKRRLNTEFSTALEVKQQLEERVLSPLNFIMAVLLSEVAVPDLATEIVLYGQNTSRWKIRFEQLTDNFSAPDGKAFVKDILDLGNLNKRNPSVENIYYEASKFIAKKDKSAALDLYMRYLYQDLKSATFDNKPLTKTIQKNLFANAEQVRDFEMIVAELIRTKDLDKALEAVAGLYTVKRKKIKLDKDSIQEVHARHAGTVDLLNEYLKDEYEDETSAISMRSSGEEEVVINIRPKTEVVVKSIYLPELSLTPIQLEALGLFAKAGFTIAACDLEVFARQKGQFTSGLVESINEICYEHLDDVLIEEDGEDFTIQQDSYQRILV